MNESFWMPGDHSTMAGNIDSLFYFILAWSAFFLLVVTLGIIVFSLKYRRRKQEFTPTLSHNNALEAAWTIFPTFLVIAVFVWGFKDFMKLSVIPDNAYEIKATGQKWFWSFEYAEGATTVNDLVVPVDRPIKILGSSKDVLHCLYLPDFRVKKDVVPNRYTVQWFEATTPGEYRIYCAEYCGTKHSEMIGTVRVLSKEDFEDWLATNAGGGEGLTLEEYGAQLYVSKACVTCHSIDGSAATGPSWKGIFGKEEKLSDGTSALVDENYVRESILEPQAKVTAGFQPVMPTYQGILRDRELDALIAYIKSLK